MRYSGSRKGKQKLNTSQHHLQFQSSSSQSTLALCRLQTATATAAGVTHGQYTSFATSVSRLAIDAIKLQNPLFSTTTTLLCSAAPSLLSLPSSLNRSILDRHPLFYIPPTDRAPPLPPEMALTKSDSRSTSTVATSISTPRRMSAPSQVDRRVFKLPGSTTSSQKKRDLPEDCNPNIDNVRRRTDSLSSTATVEPIRAQSKLQTIIQSASSMRRGPSENPCQPVSNEPAKPKVTRRAVSAKSAVQFPKAETSQSSIPTRAAAVNNERKRLLSRSDEQPQQPRVRQRLTSSTSIDTVIGVEPMDQLPKQERRRLDCTSRSRIPNTTDPARGDVSRGALSSSNASIHKKTQPGDARVRKPLGRTQTPAVLQQANANASVHGVGSTTENVLANDAATLAYRQGVPEEDIVMCIDDLEEIPDLPLSRPSSVAQARAQAAFDPERFDVRIEAPKNTEVWDTIEEYVSPILLIFSPVDSPLHQWCICVARDTLRDGHSIPSLV